jgi:hypothetical protein
MCKEYSFITTLTILFAHQTKKNQLITSWYQTVIQIFPLKVLWMPVGSPVGDGPPKHPGFLQLLQLGLQVPLDDEPIL